MKPSELTFANLIGIETNQWHYHIPRFQREYVWRKHNWSKLIEDHVVLAKKQFAEQIAGASRGTYTVIKGTYAQSGRREGLFGEEVVNQTSLLH